MEEFCVEFSFFVEDELFCIFEVCFWFLGQKAEGGVWFWYEPAYGDINLSCFAVDIFSQFCQLV